MCWSRKWFIYWSMTIRGRSKGNHKMLWRTTETLQSDCWSDGKSRSAKRFLGAGFKRDDIGCGGGQNSLSHQIGLAIGQIVWLETKYMNSTILTWVLARPAWTSLHWGPRSYRVSRLCWSKGKLTAGCEGIESNSPCAHSHQMKNWKKTPWKC